MDFNPGAHWRDSARKARFFGIDAKISFVLLLFLLHIRWWTFFTALGVAIFLGLLERFGFSLEVFARMFRFKLAGKRKIAVPWWRL